ncbi:MAG: NAD-dependent epimerase/dehydratase family protein [Planctomycetes bacterium]|nr:NAD-dependent epimerase/dehydratase family protein [Planctomycetota bacterium]
MSGSLFITGAGGFIAGHVLSQLNPDDYDSICCLSRRESDVTRRLCEHDNVNFVRGGPLDFAAYESHLARSEVVLHLAAITGKAPRRDYFAVNADATAFLVEKCKDLGVPYFLYTSSIAAKYKNIKYYYYAQSKQQGEQIVRESGLKYTIIRPTIVLGPESSLWPSLRKMGGASPLVLPGNGRATIQPIHVDDLAKCIELILRERVFANEVLELGGPEAVSMEAFLRRIHRRLRGKEPRVLHLPLRPLIGCLGVAESFLPFLPISAGQLAAFGNDGPAADNEISRRLREEMMNVDQIIESLPVE